MNQAESGFLGARRALILCPHTDDEFGCAGAVRRLVLGGCDVRYLALSRCEESVPKGYPEDQLEKECRASTASLGIPGENVEVGRYKVRHFPSARQEILEHLVRINRSFAPELVLLPSSSDTHQDHATVAAEGFRAFKHASILGYELPQNVISFENSAFVRLSEEVMQAKIDALLEYKSQAFRPYSSPEFIRSLALVRGAQCNAPFAEAFEVVRLVI